MDFKCRVLSLIILLNVPVSGCLGETLRVTCSPQTICALRESTVTLQCSYSNTNIRPQHSFWFSPKQKAKWRNQEDPEDLALDSDYAGRVSYDKTTRYSYSYDTLTISELRERDSGEYHLMIITETGQKYPSSTAATLTVSDLQIVMTSSTKMWKGTTLTCSTSCNLTSKPLYYHWYINGQHDRSTYEHQIDVTFYLPDYPHSYSCSVRGHEQIRSNTVCGSDDYCWRVTYSDRRVCALEGSSVDFACTYLYPSDETISYTRWYYRWPRMDVLEALFDRVEFLGDKERNCTLRMNDVRKNDSGEYYFDSVSGKPGIILSVTDLQVKVSPTTPSEGQTVTLTCLSTCTLPNNPTYIWHKNGQPVTNKPTRYNKLYLESANTEDVLQYSCALEGESQRVTFSPQNICALRESTVNLTYTYSNTNITPQQIFWFSPKQKAQWRNEEDPEDLALDSDYAGRVRYTEATNSSSTLTISELRERDSGEYHLMIITETGQKYPSSTAVTLTVSDLQVAMTSGDIEMRTLKCSTSCRLTFKPPHYSWYNNGKHVDWTHAHNRLLNVFSSGSYSCSASDHDEIHSTTMCVFDENCWSVTYSDRRVCALEGSSVDFPCTYSYPRDQTVNNTFWYYVQPKVEPTDLSVKEQFAGRVEFLGRSNFLRIRNVRKSDSGKYRFRFITDSAESFSGNPGVILSVTDLQVKVSPTAPLEGQTVTLTCISTCTLPNNPTYIWYKNGQLVTNKPTRYNKLYLESANTEDVLQYSCALEGFEGPAAPKTPEGPEESAVLKFVTVGVSVFLALILITALMLMWSKMRRMRGAERSADVQAPNPGDDTYTALNLNTMSSDYDTLTHVRDSPSDTYTALSPTTMSSDYDTLTHVRSSSSETYSSLNAATMTPDYDTLTNLTGSPKNTMP